MNLSQRLADCRAHGSACLRRAHGPPLAMPQRQMAAKEIGCCGGRADARGQTGRWAKAAGVRAVGETLACAPQPRHVAATAALHAAAAMAHGCEFKLHFIKKAVLSAETGRAATQDGPFHNVKPAVLHSKSRPARMAHCKPGSWPTGGTAFGR